MDGQQAKRSGSNDPNRSKQGGRSRTAGQSGGGSESRTARIASEAASQIGDVAQQAGSQAAEAVSSLTALANDHVRRLADRQVSVGADMVAHVAEAIGAAADSLDENVPQLAEAARGAAERVYGISDTIREQSAGELLQATADLARRRPALLFGATALTGFVLYRLFSGGWAQDYEREDDLDDFDETDEWETGDVSAGGTAVGGSTTTLGGGAAIGGTSTTVGGGGAAIGGSTTTPSQTGGGQAHGG